MSIQTSSSFNHLSTVRFGASAWDVMMAEYNVRFNAEVASPTAEEQVEDHEDNQPRTRKGKLNRQTHFQTKLSDEQIEKLMDWHDLSHLAAIGYGDAPGHIKLVDEKGRKLLFHHWSKGQKASRSLRRAWKWADHIICCHSATLPSDVRCKAAVLKGGPVKGLAVISSWYEEPIDNDQAEFIVQERFERSGEGLAAFFKMIGCIQATSF